MSAPESASKDVSIPDANPSTHNSDQSANTAPNTHAPTPPPQQQQPPSTVEETTTTTSAMPDPTGDAELDNELQSAPPNTDPTGAPDSATLPSDPTTTTTQPTLPHPDPPIPRKKDATLRQFLSKMDDHTPLIPDAVTDYYLTLAGLPPPPETDRRLARLLALATQKFIADVAADAYQYSRIRSTNTTSNNPLTGLGGAAGLGMNASGGGGGDGEGGAKAGGGKKDAGGKAAPLGGPRAGYGGGGAAGGGGQGRTVLTMEDLGMAVGEYGINVKRGEFYR